ncbi:MAG: lipoate--protein ligase [Anaerolineae bacterium]|jgi:lipoate-protein ligase A|nr:lipoate--protein ligase [Anaerolineae bacterium]MDH7473754.1 lipoate--protein ligase [Anaerolineae bacterium]
MDAIRLLDLGLVPPIRSQTIYHAVAYALDTNTPDTIILVAPSEPYICIGFHQELEKEVDVEYCRAHGLPIVRREVGGGAVYLDRNQVFAQWVFHRDALPYDVSERFALYVRPLVETYHALGIPASYRPINDIHVQGRKIGGTGAAQMGLAQVVVGSLMFDFDFETMSRVLKVSSEKMRDKVFQSLNEYMTTMTRQLGYTPERDAVVKIYLEQVQATLGRRLVRGELTAKELMLAEELDKQFATDEWLYQKGGLRQEGVKIHQDVRVLEVASKTPGGLVRVTARVRDGRIDDVTLSGDFTMLPKFAPGALELALRGTALEANAVQARIEEVYRSIAVQSPGLTVSDLTNAIMLLAQS